MDKLKIYISVFIINEYNNDKLSFRGRALPKKSNKTFYFGLYERDRMYWFFSIERHKKCKPIIDEIGRILAKHYGFTDAELDFIINYDIKYRMGSELTGEGGGINDERHLSK
jgi:hypothetical protein